MLEFINLHKEEFHMGGSIFPRLRYQEPRTGMRAFLAIPPSDLPMVVVSVSPYFKYKKENNRISLMSLVFPMTDLSEG